LRYLETIVSQYDINHKVLKTFICNGEFNK